MQMEIIDTEKVLSYNTAHMGEYDWSKKRFKQILVGTRKYAWPDDTVIKIADWLDFKAWNVCGRCWLRIRLFRIYILAFLW